MDNREKAVRLQENINKVLIGKEEVVRDVVVCFLAGGHILLEDVPGVGKTTLALALARSMSCSFGRIQFTPDTLPSDVTGTAVYQMQLQQFVYQPGVVMNNIILADEINRTSPKTQAGLLEAMEEKQVSVDGKVYPLPEPFLVIATQNPIEYIGTYPLPEAQLDRFMMKLTIGYPDTEQELKMASRFLSGEADREIEAVIGPEDLLAMREELTGVTIQDKVLSYAETIITSTRSDEGFSLGASPRAFLHLLAAARANAYLDGRDYVRPDDVRDEAAKVLAHRMVLSPEARIRRDEPAALLRAMIGRIRVPV
ncbi:MAG: MoxR family ATPase [Lachnospiraceae bacterium]|nr:MoxR family ATPase [Lachnospiraceae bacterium]